MTTNRVVIALALVMGLAFNIRPAWAHTTVEVGEYEVEVGWANEPPVVGQANQIVIDIQPKTGSQAPEAEISGLTFTIGQGDFSQTLAVVSAAQASGEYEAEFTPARAGQYTMTVSGTLNGEPVEVAIDPEPVEPGALSIPSVQLGDAPSAGPFPVIATGAVVVAVVLGLAAFLIARKKT